MLLLRLLGRGGRPTSALRTGTAALGLFGTAAVVAINLLSTSSVMACPSSQPASNHLTGAAGKTNSVYDFSPMDIDGNVVDLNGDRYRGHVLIIVNVASKCGYTDGHYAELNQLLEEYGESKGLRILAFPSDQFHQEPGSNAEIKRFAREKKGAKFDLFSKIYVNGDETHPLWKFLKQQQGGTLIDAIKWNFTKFIVDKQGHPVERHGPQTSPLELRKNLEKYF
ncbi:uncharacterized protein LOC131426477 isoform X2 [Malaya genurostris]|uniref:uncharacterized protein LOC131426477 isoform X2 n=1 Tax=Malaya genurostris TaxID=325434 RepID=UPI0026F3E1C1|nr:uncharacterized protein LOC131426477 isoform X2 [Malaya genurostris]